jgi:ABC-type sugar transport system substrate-binding protein
LFIQIDTFESAHWNRKKAYEVFKNILDAYTEINVGLA